MEGESEVERGSKLGRLRYSGHLRLAVSGIGTEIADNGENHRDIRRYRLAIIE